MDQSIGTLAEDRVESMSVGEIAFDPSDTIYLATVGETRVDQRQPVQSEGRIRRQPTR